MPKKIKRAWLDPNREGRKRGRRSERYCARCGNTVRSTRILKVHNICEYCYEELIKKKDGVWTCKSCGRFAPYEVREHNGYCTKCVCRICDSPDPEYVKKTGLCRECTKSAGVFCLICGKEAAAQVRKNNGLCDKCNREKGMDNP